MPLSVYPHACVYLCVRVHAYICVSACVCIPVSPCACLYRVSVCVYILVCPYACLHLCLYACVYLSVRVCDYIYVCVSMHTSSSSCDPSQSSSLSLSSPVSAFSVACAALAVPTVHGMSAFSLPLQHHTFSNLPRHTIVTLSALYHTVRTLCAMHREQHTRHSTERQ